MFGVSNIPKPNLMYTDEVEEFHHADDEMFSMNGVFKGNGNVEEEIICKVQSFDDLKNLRYIFTKLVRVENDCRTPVGDKCHLFLENDEIKIKTVRENIHDRKFSTSLGVVISKDLGEWGGRLILISDEGEEYFLESDKHSFIHVFEYEDRVYAISSLVHMSHYHCGLHEIERSNGKYVLRTIFECYDMNFSGYYVEGNYLYFHSNFPFMGLGKINLDDIQLEVIDWGLCSRIPVSSLIKKDNLIFIYAKYNIIEYDLNSQKIVDVYTNLDYDEIDEFWFVGNDEKLIDVWDEYVIDGE